MPDKGKVTLVGAGPGDTSLITLRGLDALKKADLIIYDDLVNPEFLRSAKPDCRFMNVGKKTQSSAKAQAKINQALITHARKGRQVCRLKGGDPYIFGRGAEEGMILAKHRIPFEVIPGVTSALGCAAYAGIPLTERKTSSSVALITAHRAGFAGQSSIHWKALFAAVNTLVILMGASKLASIRKAILDSGVNPDTPMAMIQWGTWGRQQSTRGTVKNITTLAKISRLTSPSILILGHVGISKT